MNRGTGHLTGQRKLQQNYREKNLTEVVHTCEAQKFYGHYCELLIDILQRSRTISLAQCFLSGQERFPDIRF